MKAITSIFSKNIVCTNCKRELKIGHRRRVCWNCGIPYLDNLFCLDCSMKENHKLLTFKRYCNNCYIYKSSQHCSEPAPVITVEVDDSDDDMQQAALEAGLSNEEITEKQEEVKQIMSFVVRGAVPMPSQSFFERQRLDAMQMIETDPFNMYSLLRKIGQGGCGMVFEVKHKENKESFAMKRLPFINDEDKENIVNEVVFTKILQNTHIVTYYESYNFNNCLWIVTELMKCCLTNIITKHPGELPEYVISYLLREILLGIRSLHQEHRLHRDIKSDNVLLSAEGCVKLGDFGYAAQLTTGRDKRSTAIGSAWWMAPEVILRQKYDTKADIWSLGVVGLELADGEPPYLDEKNKVRVLYLIVKNDRPWVKEPQKWSQEFLSFLDRCLVKNPADRADCYELLEHPFMEPDEMKTSEKFIEFLISMNKQNNP